MGAPSVLDVMGTGSMAAVAAGAAVLSRLRRTRRRGFANPADEATFATLHTISRASPALRAGLTSDSARKAARHLRALLGADAIALVAAPPGTVAPSGASAASGRVATLLGVGADDEPDEDDPLAAAVLLAWDGVGADGHADAATRHARPVLATGRPRVVSTDPIACGDASCPIRVAVVAPLAIERHVVGALVAYGPQPSATRVRAVGEVARWVAGQLELAELDSSRARLAEAEMRALRAQISPHFVYNSLTTIASFVRTDPVRARELLLDFADFARYSFRNPREFTTLADELRSIDRYLLLERARFGDRLQFSVEVAPEVLSVAVPFLSLQPLVENAIRHGMQGQARDEFRIRIVARDNGAEAAISVEDDGVGMDPERLSQILAPGTGARDRSGRNASGGNGRGGGAGIGLANVDERMRQVYGDEYGLTVETALGAGTKVNLRVPKYRPASFPG
ncbi:histidine kinase [Actinomadura rupiterrae]|uniref:histidine kinase n=1 Tax=Actinomadura rupiterrae TaxID=559627 RepID=UPI0020A2CD4D|nr:histidine kinase [Actinomadura rupiterrae]MCP2338437.1 two-component system LytT family sensor kinase [Actinomadura rupiterrae]